tara:strand:+ start:44 stop:811 length:768 start_codon:yes stop_codon:yes gene_type:complete
MKAIIEVGAYDGTDGIALAYKNPQIKVFAFEANPYQINTIKKNKKILEKRKNIKLKNYIIYNYAVSKEDKIKNFYIAKNPRASSLNQVKVNLEKNWAGWKKVHFDQIKKIKVTSINLKTFCKKKNINKILYLHLDAQGTDLEILKSLKKNINSVNEGVIEVAKNNSTAIYKKNHTIKDLKKFFSKKFKINKIEPNTKLNNEFNVFFEKKIMTDKRVNKNYNTRYFYRIFNKKKNYKDDFFDLIESLYNRLFYNIP